MSDGGRDRGRKRVGGGEGDWEGRIGGVNIQV